MKKSDIKTLNADNFSEVLAEEFSFSMVYFHAPWCQPCKNMKPVFEQLANKLHDSDINFGDVDIAISPTIAPTYGIRSVPSVAVFRKQAIVAVIAGEMSLDTLTQRIKNESPLTFKDPNMRTASSSRSATKRATNVLLAEDLLSEAKALHINVSQSGEAGVTQAIVRRRSVLWLAENQEAIESSNAFVEKHGVPLAKHRMF